MRSPLHSVKSPPVQRRRPLVVPDLYRGPVRQERPHQGDDPLLRGKVERRAAAGVGGVHRADVVLGTEELHLLEVLRPDGLKGGGRKCTILLLY